MTRRIGLSLLLGLLAAACSPPSADQVAQTMIGACVQSCAPQVRGTNVDCRALCECATAKMREHRTDAEFVDFASVGPSIPQQTMNEINRTAKECVDELRR